MLWLQAIHTIYLPKLSWLMNRFSMAQISKLGPVVTWRRDLEKKKTLLSDLLGVSDESTTHAQFFFF